MATASRSCVGTEADDGETQELHRVGLEWAWGFIFKLNERPVRYGTETGAKTRRSSQDASRRLSEKTPEDGRARP